MKQDVVSLYEQNLSKRGFVSDSSQWRAVERLQRLYEEWSAYKARRDNALKRVAAATGARYIAQLKLQGFNQSSKSRFGTLGFRIVDTQIGDIRLTFQIWDASDGTIAWEGLQEMRLSRDTVTDAPVMLTGLLERAAGDLIAKLP